MEGFLSIRKVQKSKLTKLANNALASDLTSDDASSILTILEKVWSDLDANFMNIAKACGEDHYDRYEADYAESMDRYLQIKKVLMNVVSHLSQPHSATQSSRSGIISETRLPKLNLPTFSGKIDDWPAFKASFTAAIINRDNISDCDKLQYLKGQVSGTAHDLIKNLPNIDQNFHVAWD